MVMRYSHPIKEEAFSLFCQGLGPLDIARRLFRDHGAGVKPDPGTVQRWIQGGNWRERRARFEERSENLGDERRAKSRARAVAKLTELHRKTVEAADSLEYKTAEAAVRSIAVLQKVLDDLTRPGDGAVTREVLDGVVETIFTLLGEDELVGPVLAQRGPRLLMEIEKRLGAG